MNIVTLAAIDIHLNMLTGSFWGWNIAKHIRNENISIMHVTLIRLLLIYTTSLEILYKNRCIHKRKNLHF